MAADLQLVATELVWRLAPMTHGCPPEGANVSNTLDADRFLDAAVCPYADILTLPIFGAVVLLGVVNLPIYIRQESALIPFVLTLIIGGVVLEFTTSFIQGLTAAVVLAVVGLGPVLLLRRIDQP